MDHTNVSGHHRLRLLNLCTNDLSSVPVQTLVTGISGLEKVMLANTRLTTEQVSAICSQLSSLEHCRLTALDLSYNNLSSAPVELLAAISRLEKLGLTIMITSRSF